MRMNALMPLSRGISKEKIIRYHQAYGHHSDGKREKPSNALLFAKLLGSFRGEGRSFRGRFW
jgi:hypothetical protein